MGWAVGREESKLSSLNLLKVVTDQSDNEESNQWKSYHLNLSFLIESAFKIDCRKEQPIPTDGQFDCRQRKAAARIRSWSV
jgi:hypothetical protein